MAKNTYSDDASIQNNNFFSSLISEIKSYNGNDPLLPWLRGIRKMREGLPPHFLKVKLPRFLQKCAQTFQTDRRYRNDLRYIRVWIQLMDFVDDPKALLRAMEANHIGTKKSLYYQAYALYYEKLKKFEEAEKMYHLGVQKLAEPANELQKAFEEFLNRMERHKCKRSQHVGGAKRAGSLASNTAEFKENGFIQKIGDPTTKTSLEMSSSRTEPNNENVEKNLERSSENEIQNKGNFVTEVETNFCDVDSYGGLSVSTGVKEHLGCRGISEEHERSNFGSYRHQRNLGDVAKFIDITTVSRSESENARHHGLVEPTVNTKEALNAISSMFREPLEPALAGRRSDRSQQNANQSSNNGFEVFIDENTETDTSLPQHSRSEQRQPHQEPLQIFVDDETSNEVKEMVIEKDILEQQKVQNSMDGVTHVNAFVFPSPKDLPSEIYEHVDAEEPPQARPREDTVVYRFVGATILDEPEVENVCHHGLVDPTVNLKEAMDDINGMFGKPIEFARKRRQRKQDKPVDTKDFGTGGFLILADNELDHQEGPSQRSSFVQKQSDLFEPTLCTKEAMDEINKMFGMPLDF